MPCKPAKARHLLKAGKAKVKRLFPFTIQLLWDCEENVQPTTLGIDKGSKFTGIAVVNDETGEPLLQAEIHHRLDVKLKVESRRNNRHHRRGRKWYRPCRFNNRGNSRRESRLPQSIKTNIDEVLRIVKKLPLPINKTVVEDVLVDIRKLTDPKVHGTGYQKSNRLDENLRLACLMRDNFKCQNPKCKHSTKSLHAHHIIWRSKGGKDTIANLITLCKKCHVSLHLGKLKLSVAGVSGFKDMIAQRTMRGKAYLYKKLVNPELVFGYQTAERRKELGLDKTHMIDAFCISGGIKYIKDNSYHITFRPRQSRRQFLDLPRKGQGRVRYQINEELGGFRKGDIVKVKNRFIKQIKAIYTDGRLAFTRVKGEPPSALPKNCKLILKQKTTIYISA